jgi:hypothetical protein
MMMAITGAREQPCNGGRTAEVSADLVGIALSCIEDRLQRSEVGDYPPTIKEEKRAISGNISK